MTTPTKRDLGTMTSSELLTEANKAAGALKLKEFEQRELVDTLMGYTTELHRRANLPRNT